MHIAITSVLATSKLLISRIPQTHSGYLTKRFTIHGKEKSQREKWYPWNVSANLAHFNANTKYTHKNREKKNMKKMTRNFSIIK